MNLNSWLYKNGYLALKNGNTSREWFQDVDWSRTKAFGLGLGGLYINLKGRESKGIVEPGEAYDGLKKELIDKLSGLRDEDENQVAIESVYDSREIYVGPYVHEAPDMIVGYTPGYRVSWDSVTGKVNDTLFEDNTKAWSGDHCIDPRIVPGIIFSSHKLNTESPAIIDIAPTILNLFGMDIPQHMDGHNLIDAENIANARVKKGKKHD